MSDFLPEELAIEILARLSIKNLARFRCVCKRWRDLINHRGFAEKYRDVSPVKLVSFYDSRFYLLDVEDKNPVITKGDELLFPLPLDFSMMWNPSTYVLYCDGTLCVAFENHALMVWNPSSRKFKFLTNPDIYRDTNILGFGYDPVNNDYKLVTFTDRLDSTTAHVFEFRTGSWRDTVRIPKPDWHYRERRGTFLDHHLYWIAYRSNVDWFVLCFDLSTHEYRKLNLPVYNQGVTYSTLGVTNKKLCVLEYESYKREIKISTMEKNGSWNKAVTLTLSNLISVQDRIFDYEVEFMSFTKKNDLLVTFTKDNLETGSEDGTKKKKMFLYRTGSSSFEQVRFCNSLAGSHILGEYTETPAILNRKFF